MSASCWWRRRVFSVLRTKRYENVDDFWQLQGDNYALLPRESILWCRLADLSTTDYAVMSISGETSLRSIAVSVLSGENPVSQKYLWIRFFCQDPRDYEKDFADILHDEIYLRAKAFYIMDSPLLLSGWTLFELSSVSESILPPVIYNSTPASIRMVLTELRSNGFDGCEFRDEKEQSFLNNRILERYGSIQRFDEKIFAVMDRVLKNVSVPHIDNIPYFVLFLFEQIMYFYFFS